MEIVPASAGLFNQGMVLFDSRADKEWSLTDCTSFVIMQERKITDALTADHHFAQAGFTALLS
ncbi:MAG: type II toxin-antitoxin system VapC family toxin [Pirellulales bacterium]|nr:type II toxin-antitoxin system VapC family toxin [Pirellulales bacterium]